MHMTLEADYAVRIVEFLAAANQKVDARTISEETHVPLRFALKILRKLVADDIMISYKGAHGGYTLSRPASSITLRQVIEAVEGPYRFSRCVDNGYACNCSSVTACPFHSVFDDITQMVIQKLDEATFDSL